MHTEHLQNVGFTRVIAGWLVAIAITSAIVLAMESFGLVGGSAVGDLAGVLIAVFVGFWLGGFSISFRALAAPILHGTAIGLTSLVVWAVANAVTVSAFGVDAWQDLTPPVTVLILLEQVVAAVLGAWMGYRMAGVGNNGGNG